MAHNIKAVIGPRAHIEVIARLAGCPAPTALPFGLEIVPLGHQQIDRLTQRRPGAYFEGTFLSEGVETSLRQASVGGQLAYIETDYFGGAGSQAAALFCDGAVVMRAAKPIDRLPAHENHPINSALRQLGVAASRDMDEFDALGLGRFRDLESLGLDEWGDD